MENARTTGAETAAANASRSPEVLQELVTRLKSLGLTNTLEALRKEWGGDDATERPEGDGSTGATPILSPAREEHVRPCFDVEPISAEELAQLLARRQPLRRSSSVGLPPPVAVAKGAVGAARRNSGDRFPSLTRGRSMSLTGAQFEAIQELDRSAGSAKLREDRDGVQGASGSSLVHHRGSLSRSSFSLAEQSSLLRAVGEAGAVTGSLRQLEGVPIGRAPSLRSVLTDADFDSFMLRVVCDRDHTIAERQACGGDFPVVPNDVIVGRYRVVGLIASSVFGHAVHCIDMVSGSAVCVKIMRRERGYLEQGLDEIRLLRAVSADGDGDEAGILRFIDAFYHREQLFIVTELLRDSLLDHARAVRKAQAAPYFTLTRLRSIAQQLLRALAHVHRCGIVHADVKPENVVFKSRSECSVKLIDFGSGFFAGDSHHTYVQSRPYRAPEVVLGCPLTPKIDVWSVGCVLAELYAGFVLFPSSSIATMLARIESVLGPLPLSLLAEGVNAHKYYVRRTVTGDAENTTPTQSQQPVANEAPGMFAIYEPKSNGPPVILRPIPVSLNAVLSCGPAPEQGESVDGFVQFVRCFLTPDPVDRPSAAEALGHPWLS
eukprot:Opistho-1_new@82704